ncbi:hypothetical protein QQS21_000091 [Conoideocrella luteorostrata]|uniref:Metallo-beta-lactamase domain-containing protein n=1 Tax=Conoideocrella luteorostrata TaxID=1105319 RepID=A0AAJ0G2T1_9HYPO|nr:hypothetical protein QQS21_000091 [Conoideocrella luteorostrata]
MAATYDNAGNRPSTLRILHPHPNIYAYYDGRTGYRFHSPKPNWLDDGAFTLGVASYSIISQAEAIIFDAHITTEHATAVLEHVRRLGVAHITIVYSHAHTDHIAGAEAFGGLPIVASRETGARITKQSEHLATLDPPIHAVPPTQTFDGTLSLRLGSMEVQLHAFNIHTSDSVVLWIPGQRILFAGDTLEDTATYIAEPANLGVHQAELHRMASTFPDGKILPAHGHPDRIASGGYDSSFIDATIRYIAAVDEDADEPASWTMPLAKVVAADTERGHLIYYEQYEEVHKENVDSIRKLRQAKKVDSGK